jgi:hypothetical protein
MENKSVGCVLGSKPSSTLEFYVLVDSENYLETDDIVYVESKVKNYPDADKVTFFGTVTDIQQYNEGLAFDGDSKLVKDGKLPANYTFIAKVLVTKIDPEIFISPHPTDNVYRATGDKLAKALSFNQMEQKIPAGIMRNKEPFYVNFDYINGQKGAHISISGVSGVATKTSYATFLVYSIFNSKYINFKEKNNAKAIVFNVKGEDLLFLDKPNKNIKKEQKDIYAKLELPCTPFQSVAIYSSPRIGINNAPPTPSSDQRKEGVIPYCWTMKRFAKERLFPYLFAEGDQETTTLYGCISGITEKLEYLASENNPENTGENFLVYNGKSIGSLQDIIKLMEKDVHGDEEDFEEELTENKNKKKKKKRSDWFSPFELLGTKQALLRRLRTAAEAMNGLVRSDLDDPKKYIINTDEKSVTVIDISKLKQIAQKFIVASTLETIMSQKERSGRMPYKFIVLDELNKYAPREGASPIKDIMLDIAERGRSLGIILIGAQQSASQVEKRIVTNSSIKVNGRLDFAESQSPEYNYLLGSFKMRSGIIKPGTMIVNQPDIPAPTSITFPFPAWATRGEEVLENTDTVKKSLADFDNKFK